MNSYPRDRYLDPRDYEAEGLAILAGQLPMRPSAEHCMAILRAKMREGDMDNEKRDDVVVGPAPLFVCSVCGPQAMGYSGRIIHTICKRCQRMRDVLKGL
jgi:hypothetical protein